MTRFASDESYIETGRLSRKVYLSQIRVAIGPLVYTHARNIVDYGLSSLFGEIYAELTATLPLNYRTRRLKDFVDGIAAVFLFAFSLLNKRVIELKRACTWRRRAVR